MKKTDYWKTYLAACVVFSSLISQHAFSQNDDKGISFSAGIMATSPVGQYFRETHVVGAGPIAKLSFPIGYKSDFTATVKANSYLGRKLDGMKEKYRQKNILYFLAGYRYNFNPDIESAFYFEPRVGYALIGKINHGFCYEPNFGYYINRDVDVCVWYQNTITDTKVNQIGAIGITINMSWHNLFSSWYY
ncbi:MAG: hypothetical protein H7Y03_01365 [Chitinophagaceae bacterium]|nr:hypothetical protein [Chitinophagaceae bacterium]